MGREPSYPVQTKRIRKQSQSNRKNGRPHQNRVEQRILRDELTPELHPEQLPKADVRNGRAFRQTGQPNPEPGRETEIRNGDPGIVYIDSDQHCRLVQSQKMRGHEPHESVEPYQGGKAEKYAKRKGESRAPGRLLDQEEQLERAFYDSHLK